jgi:hypothetical protein
MSLRRVALVSTLCVETKSDECAACLYLLMIVEIASLAKNARSQ